MRSRKFSGTAMTDMLAPLPRRPHRPQVACREAALRRRREELRDPHGAICIASDAYAEPRVTRAEDVVAMGRGRPEGAVGERERRGVRDVFADARGLDARVFDAAAHIAVADVVRELR